MKKKPLKYAVQYANGGIFEVGEVTRKMRRSMKIPFTAGRVKRYAVKLKLQNAFFRG